MKKNIRILLILLSIPPIILASLGVVAALVDFDVWPTICFGAFCALYTMFIIDTLSLKKE